MQASHVNGWLGHRLVVSLTLVLACAAHARAATAKSLDPMSDDPEVERQLLQLPEGFEIQLYASEPTIINPVTISFDPQGRLWVLCLPSYPQVLPGQEPRDFITVIDPPDANGHAGKSHTFATGLSVPTGMIPGDGGAYVGQADSLLHLKDTNGDGKADQKRLLLSGFGTQDTHHTINTFRWGPDGRLYFDQGLYILSSVETPHGLRRQFGGAIWQLNTDSLDLEIFDRSVFQNNTWGRIFDQWGRPIIASAWVSDINIVLPDTPLNDSNDADYVPPLPMTKIGGDRHSGLEQITGRQFPKDWQNNLVSGGFNSQQVNRFAVDDDGEHLSTRQLSPLVISHHRKFRPVDMKIGPDGVLYISDWYNLIIQHNQVDFRDPRRGHSQGRIWRITYKGNPLVPVPDLSGTTASVLDHLKDPEQWTRDKARRTLQERDHKEVAAALGKWITTITGDDSAADHNLLEALWTYQTIDVVEPDLLRKLLIAKDARARSAATAVLGAWHDRVPDALSLLATEARDENIRVRLSAVLAAQQIPSAAAFEAALNALEQRTDTMLDFELRKTALVLRKYWYSAFQSGQLTFQNDPRRIAFALIAIKDSEAVPKLLNLLNSGQIPVDRQADLLTAVAAMGNAQQTSAVLDAAVSTDAMKAADRARLLDALADAARTRQIVPESDRGRVAPLMDRDDMLGLAAIRLAGIWRLEAARDRLKQISDDPVIASSRRQTAMNALVDLGGDDSHHFLASLAGPDKPFPVRADAIVSLAALDIKEAAASAAQLLHEPTPGDPAPIFSAFIHRKDAADALADAMKEIKPQADAAKSGLNELSAAGMSTSLLGDILRSAADVTAVKRQATPKEIQRLVRLVASQGDPNRGQELFRSTSLGCMRCHAIAGAGGNVGPDLAAIGTSAQVDFLIEHILQPGKHVKDGYTALVIDTTAGDSLTGVQLRTTADAVVLRDTTHDEIVIPKNTIKRQRTIGTLMPAGLADSLTDTQLCDLVRFLSELGKPGPFNVGHANVARRWWAIANVPALPTPSDANATGKLLLENKRLVWFRQFTNVAGEVPLNEAAVGATKSFAVLRCVLDAQSPGKVALALNDSHGLQFWIDGKATKAQDNIPLDLTAGRHTLDFWLDIPARPIPSLRCELIQVPGSSAQAQWAAN